MPFMASPVMILEISSILSLGMAGCSISGTHGVLRPSASRSLLDTRCMVNGPPEMVNIGEQSGFSMKTGRKIEKRSHTSNFFSKIHEIGRGGLPALDSPNNRPSLLIIQRFSHNRGQILHKSECDRLITIVNEDSLTVLKVDVMNAHHKVIGARVRMSEVI